MEEQGLTRSKISDTAKINIIRWWFAGAMYFLFGWEIFAEFDPIDLMFFLGITIGVGHIFVLHPLVYSMFDIKRNGKIINKKYYERTILEGVFVKFAEIFKCIFCSFLTGFTYIFLGYILVDVIGLTNSIPVEPIIYGVFFVCYYVLTSTVTNLIIKFYEKIKSNKEKRSEEK